MTTLYTVHPESRNLLIPLFEAYQRDRVFIDAVLEGHVGTAMVDSLTAPTVARLDCGTIAIMGGNPTAHATETLLANHPVEWITPQDEEWRALLEATFANRIKRIHFTTCDPSSLDRTTLQHSAEVIPDGYQLHRLDAVWSPALFKLPDKDWILESFASMDDFLKRGVGYAVSHNAKIVCSTVSAVRSTAAIDIDIETHPSHRRHGLATLAAAALALECLDRGIQPLWFAENEPSARLAEKIGYKRVDSYETYEIEDS